MTIEEQAGDAMAELDLITRAYGYKNKRNGQLLAQVQEFDAMVTQLKQSVVTLTQERDALKLKYEPPAPKKDEPAEPKTEKKKGK